MALKVLKASGGKSADFDPKAEAVRMYREGKSTVEIGRMLKRDPGVVRQILVAAGIVLRKNQPLAADDEAVAKAASMYMDGLAIANIAAQQSVSVDTVRRYLKTAGVPLRGRAEARGVPVDIDGWVKRYTSGDSVQQIADDVGTSHRTVKRVLMRAGVSLRSRQEAQGVTAVMVAQWNTLRTQGKSVNEIARLYDVAHETVKRNTRPGARP